MHGELSLGIKALGDCTQHLQSLEPGVTASVQGPFGDFLSGQAAGPSLWIAGGIGITPFLARLRAGLPTGPVHLVYLYRGEEDAAYLHELRSFARSVEHFSLTARESGSKAPAFFDLIPATPELPGTQCYVCGPPGLVAAAVHYLLAQGVPGGQIHFERFDFR